LAGILMREDEELTLELVTGALEALRRRGLERRQREIRSQIADAERKQDNATLAALMNEKLRIDRALADRRG
jgi:DNA primase